MLWLAIPHTAWTDTLF